ncbi:hypothetical protein ABZZ79_27760 [Streptomyces sp. NPDC006458]|uniref:hypothetical protein n=1 Tax=Streptomyces sp. NPDC006458 TaxID=3154302 RepID=UPI0033B411C5
MPDAKVCETYTPPSTSEDSGYCARCGMHDWRHARQAPGDVRWVLDHRLHVFAQTESRPGPVNAEGEQWLECRPTGKAVIVCQCGYTSGLINRAEARATVQGLAAEHGPTPWGR